MAFLRKTNFKFVLYASMKFMPRAADRGGRHGQHQEQRPVVSFTEDSEAQGHLFTALGGLGKIRTEDAVPPGKAETEIPFELPAVGGMVDAVHVRGDGKDAKEAVRGKGQEKRAAPATPKSPRRRGCRSALPCGRVRGACGERSFPGKPERNRSARRLRTGRGLAHPRSHPGPFACANSPAPAARK